MNYDYVIIGGGVSGMTSALILAKQGFSVALVEKSRQLAPTIRGFTRQGLFFDTGFHYTGGLGTGEPVDLFFRYLGLFAVSNPHSFFISPVDMPGSERNFAKRFLMNMKLSIHTSLPSRNNIIQCHT